MGKYNIKYYEPLEQMMAIRHQYMSKILKSHNCQDIYKFFKNKRVLDLGCGTGEFLNNYCDMGAVCSGIDIENNFKVRNKMNFKLINMEANKFLKNSRKKFDVVFLFEFLEHLKEQDKHEIFKNLSNNLNKNAYVFISTLNNNFLSKFLAINIAENLFGLIPRKTHDPNLFLSPSKLQIISQKYNLNVINVEGLQYNPIFKSFKLSKIDLVNYFTTLVY